MVYSLAKDVHYLAISVDSHMTIMAGNMQSVSENMSQLTANVRSMTVSMDAIDQKVATLEPMLVTIGSKDKARKSITVATHQLSNPTRNMQVDMRTMNYHVGRPISFINSFVPW